MTATKSPSPTRPVPPPKRLQSPLDDLHVRMLKRLTQSPTLTDAIADAAMELAAGGPSIGFFHAARAEDGELAPPQWVLAPPDARIIADPAIAALCADTLTRSRMSSCSLTDEKHGAISAIGIYFRGRAPEVVGIYAPPESDQDSLFAGLQLAATSISLWGALPRQAAAATSLPDRCIAACQDAESLSAAYQRMTMLLGDTFAITVCLGERRQSGGAKLAATSAAPRFSSSTALARAAADAMTAVLAGGEDQLWVFRDAINNEPGPVMSFALAAEAEFVFAAPLAEKGEPPQIALLLFGNAPAANIERLVAEMRAAKPKLASFLGLLRRMKQENHLTQWLSPLAQPFRGSHRYITIPIAAALGLLMFLPVTDSAPASCSIEPSSRRYVVSPQEGLLAKSLVEPGEAVRAGQEIALLDRHALELEIAAQKAALAQSQLRRDAALARGEAGQAGIFTLEAQQAEENLALLELRFDQLTVRSPIDGIVLRGDLQRTIGAPLTKGQVLFEVAPLGEMVAEIAIPEEEIHRVAAGMAVTARLDAFSGKTFQGTLERIHPRAEMRDDASVFIAEMKLDAQGAPIRPGMRGRASISAQRAPLIWSWIRRPVTRLIRFMGW